MRKRNQYDVKYELLTAMRNTRNKKKTHIIRKSGVSYQMYVIYLKKMLTEKYVEKQEGKILLTKKAFNFIKDYDEFKNTYPLEAK